MALQTITSKHQDLQQITICIPYRRYPLARESGNLGGAAGKVGYRQWADLDSLLVQLSESHAIRTKVTHCGESSMTKLEMCEYIGSRFPKLAERGMIRPGVYGGGGSNARSEDR